MDPAAPPPEQVRGTQVGGREISVFLSFEHPEQSPSKGVKNTDQNASLTKRKDGSVRLNYSTKTDITYVSYEDRDATTQSGSGSIHDVRPREQRRRT